MSRVIKASEAVEALPELSQQLTSGNASNLTQQDIASLTLAIRQRLRIQSFTEVYQQYNSAIEQHDFEGASKLLELAIELGSKKFGERHINVVNLTRNLANTYSLNKNNRKAFDAMMKARADYGRFFSNNDENYFEISLEALALGYAIWPKKRPQQTLGELQESALALFDTVLENEQIDTLSNYHLFVASFLEVDKYHVLERDIIARAQIALEILKSPMGRLT